MLIAGETVNMGGDGNISGDSIDGGLVAHAERPSRNNNSKSFCMVFLMGEDYSITVHTLFHKSLLDSTSGSLGFIVDFFILCSF